MSQADPLAVRAAAEADRYAITQTISLAFDDDPLWSWAFPDPVSRQQNYHAWWGLLVRGALRFAEPKVYVTSGIEAAAIWIPPGEAELSAEETAEAESMLPDLVADHAGAVLELLERFEANHPPQPPHYYLTLLGVHDDHRGKGIGMRLLAENLERYDAEGVPTYLESSNSANDPRYESLGFRRVGEFTTPDDSVVVGTYWREPGATGS